MHKKSLPTIEHLDILQKEYLICLYRKKIYKKIKDKEYWGRVANMKEQTIKKISERNELPNIFTCDKIMAKKQFEVFNAENFPLFYYIDEESKATQLLKDIRYHFSPQTSVKWIENDEINTSVVIGIDNEIVLLKNGSSYHYLQLKKVL